MFHHVLIATDFSEPSKRAARAGRAVAVAYEAKVTLVHVLDRDDSDEVRSSAGQLLDDLKNELFTGDPDVATVVAEHDAADVAILSQARESEADLIVAGREGAHGISEHLLGSTTERVARHATCSVLVVQGGDGDDPGFAKQVIACTDLSDESTRAVEEGGALASRFDGALTLAHVYTIEAPPFAYEAGETKRNEGMQTAAEEALEKLRADKLGEQTATLAARHHTSAVAGLCELAEETNADLIAVGTRGRTGLARLLIGSVAERVVRHAPCSVLVARR